MYVIIRYKVKEDVEQIVDVIDTYEDLVHYCEVLLQNDSSLKSVQPLMNNMRVGRCIPMAFSAKYGYYVQFHQFVKDPSF